MSRTTLLALAGLTIAAAACGDATVEKAEVEKQAREGLTKSVGKQAPPATCPGDLDAEVGATARCHMDFPDGKRLGITLKVTSVDGSKVNFDIAADDALTDTP